MRADPRPHGWAVLLLCCTSSCMLESNSSSERYVHTSDGGVVTRYDSGPPPTWRIEFREGDARYWVSIDGEPTLTPDGRAIAGLDADELVRVRERNSVGTRELEVRADEAGGLVHEYRRDGKEEPFEASAQAWLDHVLFVVGRSTALGAKERAEHLLWEGGPEAVIAELPVLANDQARTIYSDFLLGLPELSPEQCRSLTSVGARAFSSDVERARMLDGLFERHPDDGALAGELIQAIRTVSSSSIQRELVQQLSARRALAPPQAQELVATTVGIRSESERAAALLAILANAPADEEVASSIVSAASSISSSSTKVDVFRALAELHGTSPQTLAMLAQAAGTIASEDQRSSLLAYLAGLEACNEQALLAVVASAGPLSSSSARARVYESVLARRPTPSANVLLELASGLVGTASEDTRSNLLASYFGTVPDDELVLARGIEVGTSLGSSSAARKAYDALLARPTLSRPILEQLSKACARIPSTDTRADLLNRINQRLLGSG